MLPCLCSYAGISTTIDSTSTSKLSKQGASLVINHETKELKLDENSKQSPQGTSKSAPKFSQQELPLTVPSEPHNIIPSSGTDSTLTQEPREKASMNVSSQVDCKRQQEALLSTPEQKYHESSPTIRLMPQERASASINPTPQAGTSLNASVHIDSTPKLHQLGCLKLHNRRIRVIEHVASKWESVAIQLHFEGHLIETIKIDSHSQVDSACRKMFIKWLEGIGRQPITWRTLINALDEAGLSNVARELENIINDTEESELYDSSMSTARRRVKCNI